MPRTARAAVGGYCYYVLNRGNERAEGFDAKRDYQASPFSAGWGTGPQLVADLTKQSQGIDRLVDACPGATVGPPVAGDGGAPPPMSCTGLGLLHSSFKVK